MSSQQRTRSTARERRAARSSQQGERAVRSQLRTMEARQAERKTSTVGSAPAADEARDALPDQGVLSARRAAPNRRAVARPLVLTKEQEYRFIQADLRRLATTAAALFVVMIVLLFVVD